MIGVDWGTSNFRAFLIDTAGNVRDRRKAPRGVLHVPAGGFADILRAEIGDWLDHGERRILLCGAIGSREGWQQMPYLPCPIGIPELAHATVSVPFAGAKARLVPGVGCLDAQGVPNTMRGEETQIAGIIGALGESALVCLPGTHSKWARVQSGRIVDYSSHMTGEVFGALRRHTIFACTMRDAPIDWDAFGQGVARSGETGGWLHHLFGVRALCVTGGLNDTAAPWYLSGLVIGHEVRAALPPGALVHLVGEPGLTLLYLRAIELLGGVARIQEPDAAAYGLAAIAAAVAWA
ncbi:MAG TPA: 2-dehydro-3-deoxygalactonokinase [Acetobacteraceae bacterium]|nr:2-dehydro-3-deoxygalactonokinase [Acetobacteraceae bacterium]